MLTDLGKYEEQINISVLSDFKKHERYVRTVNDFLKLGYSEDESMALAIGVLIEHRFKDEVYKIIDEWDELGFRSFMV